MSDVLKELQKPFYPNEIEWRVMRAGVRNGKPWATVAAYVTNRAIQNRLDDVFGVFGWRNEYVNAPEGGILCGISILYLEQWITKWDGADKTDIEATKGGLSGSMKRAAVQWGIGRYLYKLEENFAIISKDGRFYQGENKKKGIPAFKWNPPQLPDWAVPSDTTDHTPAPENFMEADVEYDEQDSSLLAMPESKLQEIPKPAQRLLHHWGVTEKGASVILGRLHSEKKFKQRYSIRQITDEIVDYIINNNLK